MSGNDTDTLENIKSDAAKKGDTEEQNAATPPIKGDTVGATGDATDGNVAKKDGMNMRICGDCHRYYSPRTHSLSTSSPPVLIPNYPPPPYQRTTNDCWTRYDTASNSTI